MGTGELSLRVFGVTMITTSIITITMSTAATITMIITIAIITTKNYYYYCYYHCTKFDKDDGKGLFGYKGSVWTLGILGFGSSSSGFSVYGFGFFASNPKPQTLKTQTLNP